VPQATRQDSILSCRSISSLARISRSLALWCASPAFNICRRRKNDLVYRTSFEATQSAATVTQHTPNVRTTAIPKSTISLGT
jgi:hypothetical protein